MKFSSRFRYYFQKHFPFDRLLGERKDDDQEGLTFNRYRASRVKHLVVQALRISPWLCALLLLGSLGMEFGLSADQKAVFSSWIEILKTVSVGGLIGYGTNYLAIKMLFRPLQKRPILGQGMIPAQRDIIIGSLARGMHTHILSQKLIRQRLEDSGLIGRINDIVYQGTANLIRDEEFIAETKAYLNKQLTEYFNKPAVREELKSILDEQVEQKAEGGIKRLVLNTYKRFNREDYDKLLDEIIKDIPNSVQVMLERWEGEIESGVVLFEQSRRAADLFFMRLITNILHKLDIETLLAKQMAHFDEERLERMVWEATNEQLLYIQYLGTILGMLGGLVIWNAWMLGLYAGLALGVWGLDELLMRTRPGSDSNTKAER